MTIVDAMTAPRWRRWLGVVAAVATVAVLLGLPAPERARPPNGGGTGPPTLAGVWPDATVTRIAAAQPDGSTYSPILVVDRETSVGFRTGADGSPDTFVLRSATGTRVLSETSRDGAVSVPAVTAAADHLYWMRVTADKSGHARSALWTADRAGRNMHELTTDTGLPRFFGSQHDLQVTGGRLSWASAAPDRPHTTEIRSVGLSGGAVNVRRLDGDYALSAWPWVTSAPSRADGPMQLVNLDTGESRSVTPLFDGPLSCTPAWCRSLSGEGRNITLDLYRPDGQDIRRIIDGHTQQAVTDAALLDRFEVVTIGPGSASGDPSTVEVSLYDIVKGQLVLIAPAASAVHARDGFLWWSTGDNNTVTWHLVDLRTLR